MNKTFRIQGNHYSYQLQILTVVVLHFFSTLLFAQEERPLFGVQRWDMYSGKGYTYGQELGYLPEGHGFLKPEEWHHRAPFFCRRTSDVDWVTHPADAGPLWFNYPFSQSVLQTAMDAEIDFATEAGIDFFIFNGPTRTLYSNGWELHNNLDAYLNNTRLDKTKFTFALYGHEAINYGRTKVNLMLDEIIGYMQLPSWQTVKGGRPLVPVLWALQFESQLTGQTDPDEYMTLAEFVTLIRTRAASVGLSDPYIVAQEVSQTYQHRSTFVSAGFDAISDYAGAYGGSVSERDQGPTFANATQTMVAEWDKFLFPDIEMVPPMVSGWYNWARAESEKYWHYQLPESGDTADRIQQTFDFVKANSEACAANIIFAYSWNEHSEGGHLCPTMGDAPEYTPNTTLLDEVATKLLPVAQTNLALSGTASAEWIDGGVVTTLNDGDTADWSGIYATSTVSRWFNITWASPQSINKVIVYTNSNSGHMINDYTIQYWDGDSYVNLVDVVDNTSDIIESTFTPVNTTILRIQGNPGGNQYRIDEIEAYNDPVLAIENSIKQEDSFTVYSKSNSIVISGKEQIKQLQIFSVVGTLVYEAKNSTDTGSFEIATDTLAKGIYIIRINSKYTQKIIVQ